MEASEYSALVLILKQNHEETIRAFESFDKRVEKISVTVDSHDKSITKIKTVGTIATVIWGGIVLLFNAVFK